MGLMSGVGDFKLREFGGEFDKAIAEYCQGKGVIRDVTVSAVQRPAVVAEPAKLSPRHQIAFALFRSGARIENVMHQMGLSRPTIVDYLSLFIQHEKPRSISRWVADDLYQRIAAAARAGGTGRLKPIFIGLGEKASDDDSRLV